MTAGFAQRIDALHGETGQILHARSLSGRPALRARREVREAEAPMGGQIELLERILAREACGVKRKDYNRLWYGCRGNE
jgi:hypothetical protein